LGSVIGEPVADTVDGEHVARPADLGLDLAAEVLHVSVDRALVRFDRDAVQCIQQLPAREDAPRLSDERRQELELGGREVDGSTAHAGTHLRQVDLDVAGPEDLGAGGASSRPAEHRSHARHQLFGTEGFDQVVIGAELEADDPVGLLAPRREHDDGRARRATKLARDVEPVHARQAEIEHDQVGPVAPCARECGGSLAHHRHLESGDLEEIAQRARDLHLVLDDQDP
jgi:hypothetical protein